MIPIKSITLTRAEGRASQCGKPTTVSTWSQASAILAQWRGTAPELGYHKVDFTVTWADGEEYRGRYDLQRGDYTSLAKHVRDHASASSGRRIPGHTTPERWSAYLADVVGAERQAAYASLLDTYQIGDAA